METGTTCFDTALGSCQCCLAPKVLRIASSQLLHAFSLEYSIPCMGEDGRGRRMYTYWLQHTSRGSRNAVRSSQTGLHFFVVGGWICTFFFGAGGTLGPRLWPHFRINVPVPRPVSSSTSRYPSHSASILFHSTPSGLSPEIAEKPGSAVADPTHVTLADLRGVRGPPLSFHLKNWMDPFFIHSPIVFSFPALLLNIGLSAASPFFLGGGRKVLASLSTFMLSAVADPEGGVQRVQSPPFGPRDFFL